MKCRRRRRHRATIQTNPSRNRNVRWINCARHRIACNRTVDSQVGRVVSKDLPGANSKSAIFVNGRHKQLLASVRLRRTWKTSNDAAVKVRRMKTRNTHVSNWQKEKMHSPIVSTVCSKTSNSRHGQWVQGKDSNGPRVR